jgi:hypothetical protein
LAYRHEADSTVKARITVSHYEVGSFLLKHFDALRDQPLADALVLSVGRYRNGAKDKHRVLFTRLDEP